MRIPDTQDGIRHGPGIDEQEDTFWGMYNSTGSTGNRALVCMADNCSLRTSNVIAPSTDRIARSFGADALPQHLERSAEGGSRGLHSPRLPMNLARCFYPCLP